MDLTIPKTPFYSSLSSILIIRGGALGDFILTLPALHAVRTHQPKVRLEIMGYPHIAELARERFYTKTIRPIDHRSVAGFFTKGGDLDEKLCRYFKSFDTIVSYLYDPDQIFFENLKRAGSKRMITAESRPKGMIHASKHLAQWLPELGIPLHIEPPKLYPTTKDREEASHLFPQSSKSTVALHLGSGSRLKNWPMGRFLELTAWLKEKNFNVMIVTGPADSDVKSQFWKDPASMDCIRCHNIALPVLAAALQKCIALVGHDSGISHLSAAVGTPTIAIFGPTNPKFWEPQGKSVTVLRRGTAVAAVTLQEVQKALEHYPSINPNNE